MSATRKTSRAFQLGRLSLIEELLEQCRKDKEIPSEFLRTLEYYEMEISNTIIREYPKQHTQNNN